MKLRTAVHLDNPYSCRGCPMYSYKPEPDSGGLIPPDFCEVYGRHAFAREGNHGHGTRRLKKCIQELGL